MKSSKINNADLTKIQEDLDELKHNIETKIMEIEIKLDLLLNTSPKQDNNDNNNNNNNDNKNNDNSNEDKDKRNQINIQTPNKMDISGITHLMKKIEEVDNNHRDLDKSFKRFLSSFNLNDILEDLAKLKDVKADKCDIPDTDLYNNLFDEMNKNTKKLDNEIEEIKKRMDNIYLSILNKDNSNTESDNHINKEMLQGYVTKDDFETHVKENEDEFYKIKKEISKIKENLSQVMIAIKKKAESAEINNLRNNIMEKMEELVKACNIKFADKNECLKNFKHIEEQLKKILFLLKKKNEQNIDNDNNNWLLAKKPINGYSCASCESYLGDLSNDIKKYIPWNRLPLRESSDNLYRMGSGYSKMLQMINFDNNGNVNINPEMNNDEVNTYISNNDSNMINMNNIMGKTFYAKQRNIQSKTPVKIRIQSASNDLVNDNTINNNLQNNYINKINNNNNIMEENKNYWSSSNNANNFNKNIKNKRGSLPKIKNEMTVEGFEKDENNNNNNPKITKIIKKSHSKSYLRQSKKI